MGVITQKQIQDYYKQYSRRNPLTFTKGIIRAIGLDTRQIFLKAAGQNFPCIIYACGLTDAKILVNIGQGLLDALARRKTLVNLRFYFNDPQRPNPVAFFVSSRIENFTPYNHSAQNDPKKTLFLVSLQFSNTPPDELISVIGSLLDANDGFTRRKEIRIEIDPVSLKRLGLRSKLSYIQRGGQVVKCILRDISFSGSQIVIPAACMFSVGDIITINFDFETTLKPVKITGTIMRSEVIADHAITLVGVKYDEENIPLEYKVAVNDYHKSTKFNVQAANAQQNLA